MDIPKRRTWRTKRTEIKQAEDLDAVRKLLGKEDEGKEPKDGESEPATSSG